METGLEDLVKKNQQMLSETLHATRQLTQLAASIAQNHEARIQTLTSIAEHHDGRLDRPEPILETMASRLETLPSLIDRFARGHRAAIGMLADAMCRYFPALNLQR